MVLDAAIYGQDNVYRCFSIEYTCEPLVIAGQTLILLISTTTSYMPLYATFDIYTYIHESHLPGSRRASSRVTSSGTLSARERYVLEVCTYQRCRSAVSNKTLLQLHTLTGVRHGSSCT